MSATTIPVHFRVSKDGSLHSVKLGLEAFGSASHQYASACQEAEGTLNAMTLATEGRTAVRPSGHWSETLRGAHVMGSPTSS